MARRMLEEISNAGDGNSAYIDTLQEAQKVLVNDINATLNTIAKDTKLQVEFNPALISSYHLIGYENRRLNIEDFKNDRVDAGDVGEVHSITALYEITMNDDLRYQPSESAALAHSDELGLLKIRYKLPDESNSREMSHIISVNEINNNTQASSNNFRFSAAVAAFGLSLQENDSIGDYSLDEIIDLARNSRDEDSLGYRSEFLKLVNLTESLR